MGEPAAADARRRRRWTRDGILFSLGVGGIVIEYVWSTANYRDPRVGWVVVFVGLCSSPIAARKADRVLDALREREGTNGGK